MVPRGADVEEWRRVFVVTAPARASRHLTLGCLCQRAQEQLTFAAGVYTVRFCPPDGSLSIIKGFFGDLVDNYVGIWYTGDANPNKPVNLNTKGIPSLSTAGGTTLMKITDIQAGPNPNVTATLEVTGNLRLINEINKVVLWQSFDHPTNVLLPGMTREQDKIGP
ncbi:hypothetical protein M8C21_011604 [Ambrosia artemisiifolia]|uniref:Bulb-type lectin domain-containing protein n=1 Tax=Ambrosia artemisiifolia TaxID=4212 RepID=A0AAD5GH97_AMBAR|nr:hypothetical protein M8C21_011604 [Ambrosia artemisiifolia]